MAIISPTTNFYFILLTMLVALDTKIFTVNPSLIPSTMHIYSANSDTYNMGYDNCDMRTNGELNIVNLLIKPGHIIFDIGANKGEWSKHVLSISTDIHLYAFEPIPNVFRLLKANLNAKNIRFFNIALAEENATKNFFYYDQTLQISQLSSLHRRSNEVEQLLQISPAQITVPTRTLDSICQEEGITYIDFVKIDTEGAEWQVLKGATNLLRTQSIAVIQFEYGGTYQGAQITLKQVYEFLSQHNYHVYKIVPEGLIHLHEWNEILENYRYSNYLAISPS